MVLKEEHIGSRLTTDVGIPAFKQNPLQNAGLLDEITHIIPAREQRTRSYVLLKLAPVSSILGSLHRQKHNVYLLDW